MASLNTIYMLLIGLMMTPLIENEQFLGAFNIRMQSSVLTIWLVFFLFKNSVHLVLMLGILHYSHLREYHADDFSVDLGLGEAFYMGMVRNFAANKDFMYQSEINRRMNSSHPTLLSRLKRVEKRMKAKVGQPSEPLL